MNICWSRDPIYFIDRRLENGSSKNNSEVGGLIRKNKYFPFIASFISFLLSALFTSLQNRRIFKRISGEERRKRGQREARGCVRGEEG